MNDQILITVIGFFATLLSLLFGYVIFKLKRNEAETAYLLQNNAVHKNNLSRIKNDHDELIRLQMRVDKCEKDITNAHKRIRGENCV